MKISTKGIYGLIAIVDLAIHSNGDYVPLNSIAERQNISASYLEQVFAMLRKAGIVKSVKGPQGGYAIADNLSKVTAGDILEVLEGKLTVITEADVNSLDTTSIDYCIRETLWKEIDMSINSITKSMSLQDLVDAYREMNGSSPHMYYI